MAISATASLVSTLTADPARPTLPGALAGHGGWNNPYGDPSWIADADWYRRVQLTCSGNAGEVVNIVNWEITDNTLQSKTQAQIDATTAGTTASPFGATVNNTTTWTVWASTGSSTAGQAKYAETGTRCVSTLRANGARVQVLLGKKKYTTGTTETYTVAAFLPGAGKTPTATTTVTVQSPFAVGGVVVQAAEAEVQAAEAEVQAAEAEVQAAEQAGGWPDNDDIPDETWKKADIAEWIESMGGEPLAGSPTKAELLQVVDDMIAEDDPEV